VSNVNLLFGTHRLYGLFYFKKYLKEFSEIWLITIKKRIKRWTNL